MLNLARICYSLASLLLIIYCRVDATSIPIISIGIQTPIDPGEAKALKAKAQAWIESHPEGYVYRVSNADGPGFVGKNFYKLDGNTTYNELFIFSPDPRVRITLGFTGEIDAEMSADDLQNLLQYFAPDRLPMLDLEHPSYWDVSPRTSLSSFSEGVTIEDFDGSRLNISVKTSAYAIVGDRNDLSYDDRPMPEGAVFQVRQEIPILVVLNVPIMIRGGTENGDLNDRDGAMPANATMN